MLLYVSKYHNSKGSLGFFHFIEMLTLTLKNNGSDSSRHLWKDTIMINKNLKIKMTVKRHKMISFLSEPSKL